MWRVEHVPKRTYRLLDADGRERGRLAYPGVWRETADVMVPKGLYVVRARHPFTTTQRVLYQDVEVATIHFGWNGITIRHTGRPAEDITLKKPSFWRDEFVLFDATGRERARLRSRFNWRRIDPDLELTAVGEDPPAPLDLLLALYAVIVRHRSHNSV
jgi:hypothetical protein